MSQVIQPELFHEHHRPGLTETAVKETIEIRSGGSPFGSPDSDMISRWHDAINEDIDDTPPDVEDL